MTIFWSWRRLVLLTLISGSYKCCIATLIWLKVLALKYVWFATFVFLIMGLNFKIITVIFIMIWQCCVWTLAVSLLPLLMGLIMVLLLMTSATLKQFVCKKILFLTMIVGVSKKIHIQDVNIKSRVYNYYFDNLVKVKKLETTNILIDDKNYKDLLIYFSRYVHSKSIKMSTLYYYELMRKV